MKQLKLIITSLLSLICLTACTSSLAFAAPLSRVAALDTSSACSALTQLNPGQDCHTNGSGVTGIIKAVVNILSVVVGIAAVIMIIIAGFKFVSSGGDANTVKSARETLIYAMVGIAVAILAQFLVHFVINTSTKAAGSGYFPAETRLEANA